jgi:hypothetical protein
MYVQQPIDEVIGMLIILILFHSPDAYPGASQINRLRDAVRSTETSKQLIKHKNNKLKVLLHAAQFKGNKSVCIRVRPTGTEPLVQWLFS